MTVTLETPISAIIGNKRRIGGLKALGVTTCGDALTYYPHRLADAAPLTPLSQVPEYLRKALRKAPPGDKPDVKPVTFPATVRNVRVSPTGAHGSVIDISVDDADYIMNDVLRPGAASLVFFSHNSGYVDYLTRRVGVGERIVVKGIPKTYNDRLQFTHPEVLVAGVDCRDVADGVAKARLPRPVYHANSRITTERIHESIIAVLDAFENRADAGAGTSAGTGVTKSRPDESLRLANVVEPVAGVTTLPQVPDVLPEDVRVSEGLMHRAEAFEAVHRPSDKERFSMGLRTLRFEEAFISQVALLRARADAKQSQAFACAAAPGTRAEGTPTDGTSANGARGEGARPSMADRFIRSLPFQLTDGQRKVIADIDADMAKDTPMQRLLQGEVGSGKTVVALATMLRAVDAGYQAVLVAPTQVLAEQHMDGISRMLRKAGLLDEDWEERFGGKRRAAVADDADAEGTSGAAEGAEDSGTPRVPVALLTSGMRLAPRRRSLALAASGDPCIVIATHAAFSATFQMPRMALTVIDEQHRFGVEQRDALRRKSEKTPHLLVMTATPIPRTAAMLWFGDLDISELTELPGGRKPIRTIVVSEADGATMTRMFTHLRQRIDAGERVYVVCPAIDENTESGADEGMPDIDDYGVQADGPSGTGAAGAAGAAGTGDGAGRSVRRVHSVVEVAGVLRGMPQFSGIELVTLTGRDDAAAKHEAMDRFSSGRAPLMVATTVVEVGVDVPEASCIVIFDADHFGLSQLHQLRGRVGRGGTDAWCFLVSKAQPGSLAAQRLEVIRTNTDGATIAKADMTLRGVGDVLGDAQAGKLSSFKLLSVADDADLIENARGHAQSLLAADPTLKGHVQLAGAVLDFMRGKEEFLVRS